MGERNQSAALAALLLASDAFGVTASSTNRRYEPRRRYRREAKPKPPPDVGACKRDPRPWFTTEAK